MEIKELLEEGRARLKKLDFADPIKESIYILSKLLEVDKSYLYTNLDKWVGKEKEEEFLKLIDRRASGEPMSYIFNIKEFMGLNFFVEKGVLIPRPETEDLVEFIIDYIGRNFKEEKIRLLDIGIGSGAIALSIASNCKNVEVLGVDISDEALRIASQNKARLNLENVSFRKSDIFQNIGGDEKFSIIVSNPPYIRSDLIDSLQGDVKNFEPKLALDGGEDGLEFYRRIIGEAKAFLRDGGLLIFEIGYDQADSVEKIFEDEGFKDIRHLKDLQGLDRMVLAFKK